jgi:hypothetical protein
MKVERLPLYKLFKAICRFENWCRLFEQEELVGVFCGILDGKNWGEVDQQLW